MKCSKKCESTLNDSKESEETEVFSVYTTALAQRVHGVISSAWWDQPLSAKDVADVLQEAFHQIGRDIRAGNEVEIDYLGRFQRVSLSCPWVIYRPDEGLL